MDYQSLTLLNKFYLIYTCFFIILCNYVTINLLTLCATNISMSEFILIYSCLIYCDTFFNSYSTLGLFFSPVWTTEFQLPYCTHLFDKNYLILNRFYGFFSSEHISSYLNYDVIGGWLGIYKGCSVTYYINFGNPSEVEKGSLPQINWKVITPNDQISTFLSYGLFCIIYGAIVMGVPQ